MNVGLSVEQFSLVDGTLAIGPEFGRVAREADAAGLDSLWVMDHLFQIGYLGPPEDPMLEGYTALAFAAGQTSRITLGTMVTAAVYRHPGMLVKTVTALDVLSGGRAWLGIGAAWNEDETRSLGIPFPPLGERFERLEETLQIALQMWSGDERPYEGRHYQLARPLNSPNSIQRPHPPILIGGGGEQKTLRLVAQYADACNLFAFDPAMLQHKLAVLRERCDEVGRPYDAIEKTAMAHVALDREGRGRALRPRDAVESLHALAELGIDHAILGVQGLYEPGMMDLVGELAAYAAPLVPAGRAVAVA
jgi:F420-dependent oxidoreductase-like protein